MERCRDTVARSRQPRPYKLIATPGLQARGGGPDPSGVLKGLPQRAPREGGWGSECLTGPQPETGGWPLDSQKGSQGDPLRPLCANR